MLEGIDMLALTCWRVSTSQTLFNIARPRVPKRSSPTQGPFKTGRGRVGMHLGCLLHQIHYVNCENRGAFDKIETSKFFCQFKVFFC